MDHFSIVKRAFNLTWRYKALWLFGILIAIFAGGSSGGGGGNSGYNLDSQNNAAISNWLPSISSQDWAAIGWVIGASFLLIIIFGLIFALIGVVVRYVAETALMRMVDEHERTGQKVGIKQGFRMGWSHHAFYIFVMDLIVTIPAVIVFIVLYLFALMPLLLWATNNNAAGAIGTIITLCLLGVATLLLVAFVVAWSLLQPFFWRACVIENLDIGAAFKRGYSVVHTNLGDAVLLWLLRVGVGIIFGIASFVVMLIVLLIAALIGGIPAAALGLFTSIFTSGPTPWIVATLVGIPLFLLFIIGPSLLIQGLWVVFRSSYWTLSFRELRALKQ